MSLLLPANKWSSKDVQKADQEHSTEDGGPNQDKMERQATRSTLGLSDSL
jgi:hypothetical protein